MICSYNLTRGWTEEGYLPEAVLRDLAVDARTEP
jgi:hypothetical protein